RGDVVMRGPDPARGEHVAICRAQRIDRRDDLGLRVAYNARFDQIDAEYLKKARQVVEIGILCPAREDLVPDHDQRCGWAIRAVHPRSLPSHDWLRPWISSSAPLQEVIECRQR